MAINLGFLFAIVCAVVTQIGFLCKHRGAHLAPLVSIRAPIKSAVGLFRSSWFAIGMLIAATAWLFHVAALALAPLSVVQVVLSTGVVILAVFADRVFGLKVGRRQWIGVAMTAFGLGLLVFTLPEAQSSHGKYSLVGMLTFETAMLLLGMLLITGRKLGAAAGHHGIMLGAAAGILFGVSDVAIKALMGIAADGLLGALLSPWLAVTVFASVIAFYASARGLQDGEAVPVIASTATAANVSTILGGIVVFGDPLAGDFLGIVIQVFAFGLVIMAAILTPPSLAGRPRSAPA